jgi:hypothetical protein
MLQRQHFNNEDGSNVLSETVESTHQTTLVHCPQRIKIRQITMNSNVRTSNGTSQRNDLNCRFVLYKYRVRSLLIVRVS